jgi:hypothetical protein
MRAWGRAVTAAAIACCFVGCGDSNVDVTSGRTAPAGLFIGRTAADGDLSIAVGSIRAVFFHCGAATIYHRFDPPEPVATDGGFAVDFQAAATTFTVTGEILDDDHIEGAIAGDPACNGSFTAQRCDPSSQACADSDGDLVPNEIDPDVGMATPTGVCGNGVLEKGEECDKSSVDNSFCFEDVCTCDDFCDDAGGTLSCNADCTLDFGKCTGGGCEF